MIAAEGGTPRVIDPAFQYESGPPKWSADGRTLYFNAGVRTTTQLFSVPAAGGEAKQLSNVSGVMGQPSFSADGSVVAFVKSDIQHPEDVYVAKRLPVTDPIKLTDHNPQVRELALGSSEVLRWKSKDGMEMEGLVIYPVGYEAGKRYPTVAFIHGGPADAWTERFPNSWGNFGHVWAGLGIILSKRARFFFLW